MPETEDASGSFEPIPLQTRIFVPPAAPYQPHCWVETIVGRIIAPLISKYSISEFWFSRYGQDKNGSSQDTDLTKIPSHFESSGSWRSVRFRLWLSPHHQQAFESDLFDRVKDANCAIADLRVYDPFSDLAKTSLCGGEFSDARRHQRKDIVRDFLCATSRLFIHMLEGPNHLGEFELEKNPDRANCPDEATFQYVHHLFCNLTEVPLSVSVPVPGIGTSMYPAPSSTGIVSVRVRF